ncbi:putative peptide zinc metalloprotease protein [Methylobacterium sp. 174MFSha1.1]|uniref:hypothetical protein n=1 Tax=Methylobacterium sp. 174MFSha1.1 TaxID=1502749 RepID=UPI0008F170AB|nr:hypothetical protein [Methylobacterium sp. 174MFSha1.1]SFV05312.1 putative peptide zinc metalloprotease protein [Methylobacterium sp. 174MFSha1.1]
MAAPFLSAAWYRVGLLTPTLRSHVRVARQVSQGKVWYVLSDELSGQHHRLTRAAYEIVARMDGRRTLDALWTEALPRLEEEAPSQDDVIQLLGQLHAADVLRCDLPPDIAEAMERARKRERTKLLQPILNPLSIKLPLGNPDRLISRLAPFVAPLLGPWAALAWLLAVGSAVALAGMHWSELTENWSDRALAADNLVLMAAIYVVVKGLHEVGHGVATRHFGGTVPEWGVMLLVLYPVPYVDASAAAAFASRRARVLVSLAGILVELFLAALALFVWISVEPGLVRSAAFNVMLIAGVSTLLVNGNPLLRFDAYYALTDLADVPNLGTRANKYYVHLVERHAFGVKLAAPFPATRAEARWFLVYAPLALIYRLGVTLGIALFVANEYLAVGVMLALWSVATAIAIPWAKTVWAVLHGPRYEARRGRAVGLTFGALAVVLAALTLIPLPLHTNAEGIVWLPDTAFVRAGTEGFVAEIPVRSGERVEPGTLLVRGDDPVLRSRLETLQWRHEELQRRLVSEQFTDRVAAEVTRMEIEQVLAARERDLVKDRRLASLSQTSGHVVVPGADDLRGRFVREGDLLGYVLPPRSTIIRAVVSQDDIGLLRQGVQRTRVQFAGSLGEIVEGRLAREVPSGRDELPSRALSTAGGGHFPLDPRDTKELKTLNRVFQLDVEMPDDLAQHGFGARAYLRFEHAPEPIAMQAWRRLRQLFLTRLHA